MNQRLRDLSDVYGQSPWLDNLQRSYLTSGKLQDLVGSGVRGLTSNPTIFQKAIQGSTDYDAQFKSLMDSGLSVIDAYWEKIGRAHV
jgi:transaldolase